MKLRSEADKLSKEVGGKGGRGGKSGAEVVKGKHITA